MPDGLFGLAVSYAHLVGRMQDHADIPPEELAVLIKKVGEVNARIDAVLPSLKSVPLPRLIALYRELGALHRELARAIGEPVD